MCFQVFDVRSLSARRVYKVFYQEPDGILVGLYYNMRFRLGHVKRIVARGRKIDSIDSNGRSKHGLYVYTAKARALRVLAEQRTRGARVVLVVCEVEPEDFLHRSAPPSFGFGLFEATYRAIKPLKVIS